MKKKKWHYGKLSSPRLKKVLHYLQGRGLYGATTMQICEACQTTRPPSDISELRFNGVSIITKYEGKTNTGRKIYRYITL